MDIIIKSRCVWSGENTGDRACDRIKEENTTVVEFVELLQVQAAQLFPLTDIFLSFPWCQRSSSIFTEKVPAGGVTFSHSLTSGAVRRTGWGQGLTLHSAWWTWGHKEGPDCRRFLCWSYFLYLQAEDRKTSSNLTFIKVQFSTFSHLPGCCPTRWWCSRPDPGECAHGAVPVHAWSRGKGSPRYRPWGSTPAVLLLGNLQRMHS